jgi:hypothetical protein
VGCEARKIPAEGEVFFLDFFLYRTYRALTLPILLRDNALDHRALVRLGRSARGQKLCSVLQTRRSQDYGFKPPTV